MEINTLFNIGDTIYYLEMDKICSSTVEEISVGVLNVKTTSGSENVMQIVYKLKNRHSPVNENKSFSSVSALTDHLRLIFENKERK